jgi:hypothetical protein
METAPKPVKQIKGGFWKFSVTFVVDNVATASRGGIFPEKMPRAPVFPLGIARIARGAV